MTSSINKPNIWPALTLAVLAPIIGEVLTGATRLSFIFVLVPEIMVWGCGALIIRETVRRWRSGGTSLVLLGLALAVAEEWVIQQTSLAPFAWPGASASYDRMWGVNWVWFLAMLGYECVWITLVPVQVAELIFRKRRDEPWLRTRGLVVTSAIFLLGSFIAWFLWTRIARPKAFHAAIYQPPAAQILLGVLMIMALAIAAFALRNTGKKKADRWTLPAWTTVIVSVVLASPWFWLVGMIFIPKPIRPFWFALLLGCAWGVMAWTVVHYLTASRGWDDMRRWALIFGTTLASMACGFAGSNAWPKADLIAKIIFNILAVGGFVLLAMRLRSDADTHSAHRKLSDEAAHPK